MFSREQGLQKVCGNGSYNVSECTLYWSYLCHCSDLLQAKSTLHHVVHVAKLWLSSEIIYVSLNFIVTKITLNLVLISNNENDEIYVTSTSELLPGAFCASDFVDDPFE